ncbi:hypothetical protein [Candidatus Minimicrobia vallesae]|uniref:hypothetical protein n=1 Tax=Candidatus Minimicrobia vallesae TaxID=2841264 RepID=UPI001E4BCA82|nr:hypothetical protein [Candidatus Minimicrobia vallesae]
MQPELQNQQSYQQVPQTNAALPGVPQQPSGAIGSGPNPTAPSPDKTPDDKKQKGPISTQNTLLFSEMRENMIIMSDGSFRAVVECESINFDLMSSREREGIEFSYQNFINSLYFPIQVLIRSRRVDIGPYLDRLAEIRRNQDNMLLNVLMDDYMDFIDILAQEANIMDKSFYVVVPYYPAGEENAFKQQTKGLFNSFFSGKKEATVTKIDQVTYTKAKDEIKNRIDSVMNGLFQMGVKSWQLNTRQLGELFYTSYNPDTSSRESLEDIDPSELTTTYVTKGTGPSPRGGRS